MCRFKFTTQVILWALFAMIVCGVAMAGDLPDPKLTPGVVDPQCTVDTLKNSSTSERRATSAELKKEIYAEYGVIPHKGICAGPRGCEVDHRLPLSSCGADVKENLWIMPYDGICNATEKDHLEVQTWKDITSGRITLEEGQRRFLAPDWRVEYKAVFGKDCD